MFDWIKGGKDKTSNVVPFPEVPESGTKPVPESEAKIFYRIGVTDRNRISFAMGHTEITMTKLGVQNLIDQLEVFRDQLANEEDVEE
jgi:hypothetical protein